MGAEDEKEDDSTDIDEPGPQSGDVSAPFSRFVPAVNTRRANAPASTTPDIIFSDKFPDDKCLVCHVLR
jgi:hypothetical protein